MTKFRSVWQRGARPVLLVLIQAVLIGAGCASRETGYRISKETTAFIQPGATMRAEIVENLGTPLLELKEPKVMVYSWGRVRPSAASRPIQPQDANSQYGQPGYGTPHPSPLEEIGSVEAKRWIYCVALDAQDRVTRAETLRLENEPSLEGAVRRWAGAKP